jgi:hypothetical protein
MSTLTARLNASKQNAQVMYSVDGAKFQEVALSMLDCKGSAAHKSIGQFVTAINNNQITYTQAIAQYTSLLK